MQSKNYGVLPASVDQIHEALEIVRAPYVLGETGLRCQVTPLARAVNGKIRCLTPFGVRVVKVESLKNFHPESK